MLIQDMINKNVLLLYNLIFLFFKFLNFFSFVQFTLIINNQKIYN